MQFKMERHWSVKVRNVLLPTKATSLACESVANVPQLITIDKSFLSKRVGSLPLGYLPEVYAGVRLILFNSVPLNLGFKPLVTNQLHILFLNYFKCVNIFVLLLNLVIELLIDK